MIPDPIRIQNTSKTNSDVNPFSSVADPDSDRGIRMFMGLQDPDP
jgi:hypothetical protein